MRHEMAIFGPKKTKPEISVVEFFAFVFSFFNKKHKNLWNPIFIVFLQTLKQRVFKI